MKIIKLTALILVILINTTSGQNKDMPKLVVGIVVDQMRFDYLTRYENYFGEDGFKRLMRDGSNFTNAHLNYIPAYTAPGHATIFTGTTPHFHGIIANDWYDKYTHKSIYCLSDSNYYTVGSSDNSGEKSPAKLLSSTITDELKLFNAGKSKVISISVKDRGAILPGGHLADMAFWYNKANGNFVTSTYYMKTLPAWLIKFNEKKLPLEYLSEPWTLALPKDNYQFAIPDESSWEKDRYNEDKRSFPHNFSKLTDKQKMQRILSTPFGNDLLLELALKVLDNESIGKDATTDFLTVSFSTTDYVGHSFGPNSYEIMDTYIRLDRNLESLFKKLDETAGFGNYVVFLTADHGALTPFGYLKEKRMPTGTISTKANLERLYGFAEKAFGTKDIIESYSNLQIFLNDSIIQEKGLEISFVRNKIAEFLRYGFPEITKVFTRNVLQNQFPQRDGLNFTLNGFSTLRSGDIAFELQPGYVFWEPDNDAASHESRYNYDSHVPLLFYGWNIPAQRVNTKVYTVDIAPTIADLLGINSPNAAIGIPLINK